MRIVLTVGVLLWVLPSVSEAALLINEIAWMGSVDSTNDEWIELYNNSGSSVNVDGWTLRDGMNLEIALAGTVGAGSYAVLERTDDTSAPGAAFLVYTGALANTGATLTLRDANGTIVDQVGGGENWENVGGDNVTKETAQLTNNGWVTGGPTPGRVNVTSGSVREADDEPESETANETTTNTARSSTASKSKTDVVELVLPDVTLELTVDAPERVYVNQPVSMTVEPGGVGKTIQNSLTYEWNFGDAEVGEGKEVQHIYQYPGTYIIVVEAAFARQHAQLRREITVLPVNFSITRNRDGDVQIHNNAKYEIDLSGYVVQGLDGVTLPRNTILLPNATLTIPAEKLVAAQSDLIVLADTAGELVATNRRGGAALVAAPQSPTPHVAIPMASRPIAAVPTEPPSSFAFATEASDTAVDILASATSAPLMGQSQVAALEQASPVPQHALPYLGLIGVLSLGFLAVVAGRNKDQAEV